MSMLGIGISAGFIIGVLLCNGMVKVCEHLLINCKRDLSRVKRTHAEAQEQLRQAEEKLALAIKTLDEAHTMNEQTLSALKRLRERAH